MDLSWLALSAGFLAMLVVAYIVQSIGKQDAAVLQRKTVANLTEVGSKTSGKLEHHLVQLEFSNEVCCLRSSLAL